jgi:hypothetical protein
LRGGEVLDRDGMHVRPEESLGEEVTLHGDDVFFDERAENADERVRVTKPVIDDNRHSR